MSSGGVSCVRTQDRAEIAIERPGQPGLDCSTVIHAAEPIEPTVLEGRITRSSAFGFEIDTCAPNADCEALLTNIRVSAPGLSFWLPAGAFVQVTYQITKFYACQQGLQVITIPSWGGVQSPFQPHQLLLAVSDGGNTFSSSPYRIERVALGCRSPTQGCGGVPPDEYALVVISTAVPERRVRVGMGESKVIDLSSGPFLGHWTVRNLRSYQTDICDDYWNFAWFVSFQPLLI